MLVNSNSKPYTKFQNINNKKNINQFTLNTSKTYGDTFISFNGKNEVKHKSVKLVGSMALIAALLTSCDNSDQRDKKNITYTPNTKTNITEKSNSLENKYDSAISEINKSNSASKTKPTDKNITENEPSLQEKLAQLHKEGKYDQLFPLEKREVLKKAFEIDKETNLYNKSLGAPSPQVTILGVKTIAKAVVDKSKHLTYIYDKNGKFTEKYKNATGASGSPTDTGVRYVVRIEKSPYENSQRPNMEDYPSDFGPYTAILFMVNSKNGQTEDNGQYFHGTSNPSSIGKDASHGCIRHDNSTSIKIPELLKAGDFINVIDNASAQTN